MLIFCAREKYRELQQRRAAPRGIDAEICDAKDRASNDIAEAESKLEDRLERKSNALATAVIERLDREIEATRERLAAAKQAKANAERMFQQAIASCEGDRRDGEAIFRRLAGQSLDPRGDYAAAGAPCACSGVAAEIDTAIRGLCECLWKLEHHPGPTRNYYQERAVHWRTKIAELERQLESEEGAASERV